MKEKTDKDKRKAFLISRRSVIMLAAIVLLVLLINIITASYSWFTPDNVNGTGMVYDYSSKARSENCIFSTYVGTKVTSSNQSSHAGYYLNQIHYDTTATTGSQSIAAGATKYFKTEIINNDENYASNVSLFITSIPKCMIAVTYPSNSVRYVSAATSDYFIIRNAYVKRHDTHDVNGPGLLVVEWFVTNNGSSTISVNLSNLYLTYN